MSATNSSKTRRSHAVLLLLAGTLVVLLPLEFAIRSFYAEPWYERLVKEQRETLFRFKTSQENLRDRDYPSPKPPGHARILVLGDSFTVGQGVPDRDQIFVEILERRLNEQLPADSRVERIDILNGGLAGSLTNAWVTLYEMIEDTFDPDVVIAVFFLRDGTRTSSMGGFFGPIREQIVKRNEGSVLYQNSYLYRFFRDRRDRVLVANSYAEAFESSYFGDEDETEEWQRAQRNLLYLRDLARARSAEFGLVVFPVLAELDGETYPFDAVVQTVASFADAEGIPVHDLLPAFRGQNGPDLWVSAYDQHPNEKGHAIAAESLEPFFSEMLERNLEIE